VKMGPRKFSFYNITGSFLWATTIVTAGFLLGENLWAKQNLEKIIIGILIVTTAPILIKMLTSKKKKQRIKTIAG
ncbi:MAG TPA: hypothetical protein VFU62_11550, partial [Hanamia sp.]|nr:hypothetical protein [Hanamia sp.]